jgi:hypothetical protein
MKRFKDVIKERSNKWITYEGFLEVLDPKGYDGEIIIKVQVDSLTDGKRELEMAMKTMLTAVKISHRNMKIVRKTP